MYVTRASPGPRHKAQDRETMTGATAPLAYRQEDLEEKPISYREEVRAKTNPSPQAVSTPVWTGADVVIFCAGAWHHSGLFRAHPACTAQVLGITLRPTGSPVRGGQVSG